MPLQPFCEDSWLELYPLMSLWLLDNSCRYRPRKKFTSWNGGPTWPKNFLCRFIHAEEEGNGKRVIWYQLWDLKTMPIFQLNASALWMLQPCECFSLADASAFFSLVNASALRMLQPCGCFSLLYGENGEKWPTQSQPGAFSAKHQKQLCHLIGNPITFSLYHFVTQNLNARILPEVTSQADAYMSIAYNWLTGVSCKLPT